MNSENLRRCLIPLAVALSLAASACASDKTHDLPLVGVRPHKLGVGDKLIVEGVAVRARSGRASPFAVLPALQARVKTTVILEGTFTALATEKTFEASVELPAAAPSAAADAKLSERVLARVTESLRGEIGWSDFAGRVGVRQEPKEGAPVTLWYGSAEAPVRLRFFQPNMRSFASVVVGWVNDDRLLRWLGITVEPRSGGLEVTAVDAKQAKGDKPLAKLAGIEKGDLLVSANGRPLSGVRALAQAFRKAKRKGRLGLSITRGDGAARELIKQIPTKRKPLLLPVSLIYLAVMLLFGVLALSIALVTAGLLTWLERRVAARIQSRVGPNRVGPQGLLQWLADGIKLLLKEDIIPDAVDRPLFKLAPYLVLTGLLGTFVALPFGQFYIISDLNVGLLYLIAITGFVALGLMMAGWSSNNKWSLLGGMRAAAQIISYEIPAGLALMTPVLLAGSLSTQSIVERQGGVLGAPWFLQGGAPWNWFIFDNPLAFVCFFIYFISALAEGNRIPFDLPEAESELVAGYQTEYSGWRFAVFMLSEWANIFVIGAISTTVFLGGWQVPFISYAQQAGSVWWQLLGLVFFFGKSLGLVFVIIWIRWTLPRFRIDQMMRLCWQYFVPWSFVALIGVALWVWLAPGWMRIVMQFATFGVCGCGLAVLFFSRVIFNWEQNPERFSWKQLY
jgi:NADH-quinone oxidoreductase subunit H